MVIVSVTVSESSEAGVLLYYVRDTQSLYISGHRISVQDDQPEVGREFGVG